MARRYTRDNRGRFSSVGATARGGRLRTAAGNKRATQTEKLAGGKPGGTIGKPRGLKPGSIKPKATALTGKPMTKAERVLERVKRNAQRKTEPTLKSARSSVVTQQAIIEVNRRGVAGRDPSVRYSQQDLMQKIERSYQRPLPKNQRASTKRKSRRDDIREEREAAAAAVLRNRRRR